MNKLAALINDIRLSIDIGRLQAQLSQLRTKDLVAADAAVGEAAYNEQLLAATHPAQHSQLIDLDRRIQILTSTAADTATAATTKGQPSTSNAARELLLKERYALLSRLGVELREGNQSPESLAAQLAVSNTIVQQITTVEAQLQVLNTQASRLARRPPMMAAAVALTLVVLWLGSLTIRSQYAIWRAHQDATAAAKQLVFERQRFEQELKIKAEFEAKRQAQKAEEAARKEEERERKRSEAIAAERDKLELDTARREAARMEAKEEVKASREAGFEKTAAQEFAKINLDPMIILSSTLKNLGSTASVKGENLSKLREFIRQAEWRQAVNLIVGGDVNGSRSLTSSDAKRAAEKLSSMALNIHVQTSFRAGRSFDKRTGRTIQEEAVFAVICDKQLRGVPVLKLVRAQSHPSGDGYILDWHPHEGTVVVFIGDPGVNARTLSNLNGQIDKVNAGLGQKIKLGELSEEEKVANLGRFADQLYGNFIKVAQLR